MTVVASLGSNFSSFVQRWFYIRFYLSHQRIVVRRTGVERTLPFDYNPFARIIHMILRIHDAARQLGLGRCRSTKTPLLVLHILCIYIRYSKATCLLVLHIRAYICTIQQGNLDSTGRDWNIPRGGTPTVDGETKEGHSYLPIFAGDRACMYCMLCETTAASSALPCLLLVFGASPVYIEQAAE